MSQTIESYLALLQEDPANVEALNALSQAIRQKPLVGENPPEQTLSSSLKAAQKIFRDRGDFELVARALEIELALYGNGASNLPRLRELARIYNEELIEEGEAARCYEQILALEPNDEEAFEFLEEREEKKENWQLLAQKFLEQARAPQAPRELATSLYQRVAQLYYTYSPNPLEAEPFLQKALEVDSKNRRAAGLLERLYAKTGRVQERLGLVKAQAEAASSRDQKARAYLSAALIAKDDLKNQEEARALLTEALKADPTCVEALEVLSQVVSAEEDSSLLIEAYETALKARPRGETERKILVAFGAFKWKALQDPEGAEPLFRRVRKSDPAHPEMLSFYEAFYSAREEWKELLTLLSTAHKVARDESFRLQIAERMAALAEHQGGQIDKAIEVWKWVQRTHPGHVEANRSLRRLYRLTGKWNALLELIKEEINSYGEEEKDRKIARYLEMVEIYRSELRLDIMVINTYNAILDLDPENAHALDALAQTYEAMNRWHDLIAVLEKRAEHETDPESVAALWRRAAKLWIDKLSNYNQAVRPLERLLEVRPKDAEAISLLKSIYQKRRNFRALLQLGKKEVELYDNPEEKRQLLIDLAELAAQRLDRPRQAIAFWNRILELDPDDPRALDALESLYERERRYGALIEIYRRKLELASDNEARVGFLQKMASLWADKIDRIERAIEVWRRILDLEPGHARAHRALRETFIKRGDFDALADLFARTESWDEYLQVLQSAADRTDAVEEKIALYLRIASLCEERLGRPEAAARAYERILTLDPRHRGAAEALRPIYREEGKWSRLVSVLEILLSYEEEAEGILPLLEELREITEERLDDKAAAFAYQKRAFLLSPYDPHLRLALERLATAARAPGALFDAYGEVLPRIQDPALSLLLTRRLAQLAEDLGDWEVARSRWEEIRRERADDPEALESLERIYSRAGLSEELLEVLRTRAFSAEPDLRRALLSRAAAVLEDVLEDADRAISTYREILEESPEDLPTLRALERLLRRQERYPELAGALARQIPVLRSRGDKEGLVGALCALGQLYEQELKSREEAISYFREALQEDPVCEVAISALEAMLPDESRGLLLAELLEPYYRGMGLWEKLAGILEIKIEAASIPERISLLCELARLSEERLSDQSRSFSAYQRALTLSPEDEAISSELGRLAAALGRYEEYANALDEAARAAGPEAAARLCTVLGPIYEDGLDRPEDARRVWRKVLEIDPEREDAFLALARLLERAGSYAELKELLDARIERAYDPQKRRALLFRKAELEEKTLQDTDRAIKTYTEILALSPHDPEAVRALEMLYSTTSRWQEYASLLEEELSGTFDAKARAEILCRLGTILERHLADPSGAVERFASALEESPRYEPAIIALERLLAVESERLKVARLLRDYYAEVARYKDLVHVLEIQYEILADGPEAQELAAQIAELQELHLADPRASYQAWRRALLANPEDDRAREQLERLAPELALQEDLAALYASILEKEDLHDAQKILYLQREAELAEDALGDAERAIKSYRALVELDPLHKEALDALERLYLQKESWKDLDDVLVRKGRVAASLEEEVELWHQVGEIRRDYLNDLDGAVAAYREALNLQSSDRRAIAALKNLYQAGGRFRDLVEILSQELDLGGPEEIPPAEFRLPLLYRIAEVYEKDLSDREQAIATYNTLLVEAPDELRALRALDRLYEEDGQYTELLEILDRQWEVVEEEEEKLRIRFRQGKIFEEKLSDLERAVDHYEEVLGASPGHSGAREALETLLWRDASLTLRVARVLEPVYRQSEDFPRLAETLNLIGEKTDAPEEKTRRFKEVALIYEERLGEPRRAFEAMSRAFKSDPAEEGLLTHLERLSPKAGGPRAISLLLREIVDEVFDSDLKIRLYLRLAELHKHDLRDLEGAEASYHKVLEEDPQNPTALDALEALYEGAGRWRDLIDILQRRVEGALDIPTQIRLLHRIAKLWEKRQNVSDAISAYEQILDLHPEDRAALDSLEALYANQARWHDLLALLERRLSMVSSVPQKIALHFRMAELHLARLNDGELALGAIREILSKDPRHEGAIRLLEQLVQMPMHRLDAAEILEPIYARRMEWHKLAELWESRLSDDLSPDERAEILTRLWRLHEEQLEDLEGAFSALARLFKEDPTEPKVRARLALFADLLDKWEDLAKALADVAEDPILAGDSAPSLCWELAQIYEERLGRPDDAIPYLQKIVQDPELGEEAARALELIFRRLERWESLLLLYEERAQNAWDTAAQKELYRKAARLLENTLKENTRAISFYRQVVDIDETDEGANEALERLLSKEELWRDLVELYLRRLDTVSDDTQEVELRFRLGQVYWQKLEELEAALDCYQEILQRVKDHEGAVIALEAIAKEPNLRRRAAELLAPIFEARADWQKQINLTESLLEIEEDEVEKIELLTRIARLWEERKEDPRRAFDAYLRAYALDLGAPALRAELERLANALSAWADVVRVIEGGVDSVSDPLVRGELLLEIGRIYDAELGQPQRAIEAYEKALENDDASEVALSALDRLYEQAGRPDDLARVLARKAELAFDEETRKELHRRLALLHERERQDPEAAIDAWREVLTITPEDVEANQTLERLYTARERYEDLVELYRQQVEQADSKEVRRDIRFKMAEVEKGALKNLQAAIETYRDVWTEFPDDLRVLQALDALYTEEENHVELLEILEQERRLLEGEARVAVGLRIGELLRKHLREGSRAIELYRELLDESPFNPEVRAALEEIAEDPELREAAAAVLGPLYQGSGDLKALRQLYELRLQNMEEREERRELLLELARLCTEGLGDPTGALSAYCRALKENLGDEEIAEIAERQARLCARVSPSWEHLTNVYEEALPDLFDGEAAARARLRLARIYEEELGQDEPAIKHLEEALDGTLLDPLLALTRLEKLYQRSERYQDLDRVLERQIDYTLDAARINELRLRRADLAWKRFGNPREAVELYRSVLYEDRQNEQAISSLEILGEQKEMRREVVEILEPIYQERGDDEALSRLYEGEVEITEEGPDRAHRLVLLADLYKNKLKSPVRAFVAISRAFLDDPEDSTLLYDLDQIARERHLEEELASLLSGLLKERAQERKPEPVRKPLGRPAVSLKPPRPPARGASTPGKKTPPPLSHDSARELRIRLARLLEGPLGEQERALAVFEQIIQDEPEHPEALDACIRLYEATSRFAELAEALLKRGEPEFDVAKRRDLLSRAARIFSEKLDEPKKALLAWKKIVESDEGDLEARAAQEALLEALGEFAPLAESLSIHCRYIDDDAKAADLIYRRAVILEEKLRRPKDALEAYREALDRFQSHEGALRALERLYTAQNKYNELQDLLLQRLEETSGAQRAPILVRLAHLAEERFKAPDDAIRYYREALSLEPGHGEACEGLLRLLGAQNRWQEVAEVLQEQLSAVAPEHSAPLRIQLGQVREHLGEEEVAIEIYRAVLSQDPHHPTAMEALIKLHEKREEWDECLRHLEVAMAQSEGEEKIRLGLRIATLHYTKRHDAESAERVLKAAGGEGALAPEIRAALKELYQKENNWAKIAEMIALEAEEETDKAKKLKALKEAVKILLEKLKDHAGAIPYMEKAHALDPSLLADLADLYLEVGRSEEAMQAFEKLYAEHKQARRNKDASRCLHRIGMIAERKGDIQTALEKYKAAYSAHPQNPEVLVSYGKLLFEAKDVEMGTRIYRGLLLAPPGTELPIPKPEIYLRLGQLQLIAGELQKAKTMFQRGLEFDSNYQPLKDELAKLK